jgi:hypothetical protein
MSPSKATSLAIAAAVLGFTIGVSGLATANFGMSGPGSQLGMPQYMKADSLRKAPMKYPPERLFSATMAKFT